MVYGYSDQFETVQCEIIEATLGDMKAGDTIMARVTPWIVPNDEELSLKWRGIYKWLGGRTLCGIDYHNDCQAVQSIFTMSISPCYFYGNYIALYTSNLR